MRQHLSRLPTIDPNTRTLLITGKTLIKASLPMLWQFSCDMLLQLRDQGKNMKFWVSSYFYSSFLLFLVMREALTPRGNHKTLTNLTQNNLSSIFVKIRNTKEPATLNYTLPLFKEVFGIAILPH